MSQCCFKCVVVIIFINLNTALYIVWILSVSCSLVLIWVNWSIGTFNTQIISNKSLKPFNNSPITKIMISHRFLTHICPRVFSARAIVLALRALKLNCNKGNSQEVSSPAIFKSFTYVYSYIFIMNLLWSVIKLFQVHRKVFGHPLSLLFLIFCSYSLYELFVYNM